MNRSGKHWVGLATALALALAGAMLTLTAGTAQAASRGFQLYNLSSHQLQLDRVIQVPIPGRNAVYSMDFEGRPIKGAVLEPGASPHDWELKYSAVDEYAAYLIYNIVGTTETFRATIKTDPFTNNSSCTIAAEMGTCTAEGLTVTVTDPPGSVRVIGAGQAQEQADTLKTLCNASSAATCDFSPTKEERISAPARLVGDPIVNCKHNEVKSTLGYSDAVGQSNSVGTEIDVEAESDFIFGKASVKVSAKYDHEWTAEHEFKQDVEIIVDPGSMAWVAATSPIYRDTGDFVLKLGNTTWKLLDIYFDTPDPKRNARFVPDDRELSAAEYGEMCTHIPPGTNGLLQAPASWVTLQHIGSSAHDRMVGGPERSVMRGLGGNDTLLGTAGHDRLLGGGGRDRLDGGRGRDVLLGGPGADTMIDHSGRTKVRTGSRTGSGRDHVDVRDGRSDDTVRCTTRRTVVVADPGDRMRGRCGKVIRTGAAPGRPGPEVRG